MHASTGPFPWGEAERRRLVRLCAFLSGDAGAAEDLAQETLLEGWRNIHKLHDRDGADRWLAAIARNVCLRRRRRAGGEAALAAALRAAPPPPGPDEPDGDGDLERALAPLPAPTRALLVDRHVHGRSLAELGAELGVSPEAVAMRLARAKADVRRALAGDTWRPTRVWCAQCGRRRLLVRAGGAVSFRCPGCNPGDGTASTYDLANPAFSALVGGVVRPTAVLARTARWAERYFAGGAGADVACTRCGRGVRLERYMRAAVPAGATHRDGLHASCGACGETASSSLGGLALVQPAVREFRRKHPRTEARAVHAVDAHGVPALVAEYGSVLGNASVAAVFERDSLRLLTVR